jgi:hypothetical protein
VIVCPRTDPLTAGKGPCTTSDASGAWTIPTVPANTNVAITFEKPTLVPTLRAISTGTGNVTISGAEGVLENDDAVAAGGRSAPRGHSESSAARLTSLFITHVQSPAAWQLWIYVARCPQPRTARVR